jgi:hypothetical protein
MVVTKPSRRLSRKPKTEKFHKKSPPTQARIALTEAAAEMYDVNRFRIEAARDPRGGVSWSIYDT